MRHKLLSTLAIIALCAACKTQSVFATEAANGGPANPAATVSPTPPPGEEMGEVEAGPAEAQTVGDAQDGSSNAGKHHFPNRGACTTTFANVKSYLQAHDVTKTRVAGVCAWQAADILPRSGFVKTQSTVANAKEGEVCVFGGSKHYCEGKPVGTIAVKTKTGWYDGCNPNPQNFLKTRPLLGCFKKKAGTDI